MPPAFYGIEYEINPGINRSRPSRYLLAQDNIVVEKNVIMNHGCPRISSQLQVAGIFGLRDCSERVYKGWRQRKKSSSFTSLMDSHPQATSLIASSCGQSVRIELHSFNFYRRDSIGTSAGELSDTLIVLAAVGRNTHIGVTAGASDACSTDLTPVDHQLQGLA